MKYYSNEIYPVALVLSYDTESVNKEYYNAAKGDGEDISINSTSEATTMFLSRKAEYPAMAVGIIFNKVPTAKLAAYEAFHAAIMMLSYGVNIPLNDVHHEEIGWWFDIYSFKDTCELEPCDMFLGESHTCDTYQEALIEAIEFYITSIKQ